MQHADRTLLGVGLMLAFCVLAPIGDSVAKLLGGDLGVLQLLFLRFALQGVFLVPLVLALKRPMRMSARVLKRTALRTALHIIGIGLMFSALRVMPLADVTAIAFVMPFILLLMGWAWLGEEVGPRRLAACTVGFGGTLMVIQPAFADVGLQALLPVGVAINFAVFMLVTRTIAKDVDPIGMQAVSAAMACIVLGPIMWFTQDSAVFDLAWNPVTSGSLALVLAMGGIGTLAHLLMTWSLRYAPASTLAPMQYLEIPFATLTGWIVFSEFPNGLALAGIAVTIASGLYVIHREQATSRAAAKAHQSARQAPDGAE